MLQHELVIILFISILRRILRHLCT